jgi:hypothetical protein
MSTLLAFIAFAAQEGGSEEHGSKTLFYILGGFAAVYAVAIAAIGITQHDFPRSESAAKAIYATSFVIVAAAMASAVITS